MKARKILVAAVVAASLIISTAEVNAEDSVLVVNEYRPIPYLEGPVGDTVVCRTMFRDDTIITRYYKRVGRFYGVAWQEKAFPNIQGPGPDTLELLERTWHHVESKEILPIKIDWDSIVPEP